MLCCVACRDNDERMRAHFEVINPYFTLPNTDPLIPSLYTCPMTYSI
jgi:hypothetical protein